MRNFLIPLETSSYLAKELALTQREALAQCLKVSQYIPDSGRLTFSHFTALKLLGVSLPYAPRLTPDVIHVCASAASHRLKSIYVKSHVWKNSENPLPILSEGMSCISPVCAWAQMSQYLSLDQLVVLGDSLMRRNLDLKWLEPTDFHDYLNRHTLFPGRKKCATALHFMAAQTDSPPETELRLFLLSLGLSSPQVNYAVRDRDGKKWLLDLALPDSKTGYEYNGWFHNSDHKQWTRDPQKRQALENVGWHIFDITAQMLSTPAERAKLADTIYRGISLQLSLKEKRLIES